MSAPVRFCSPLAAFVLLLPASLAQPAPPDLESAYAALHGRQFDAAVAGFRRAVLAHPSRIDIRKDLAWTLLKTGDTEAARDEFAEIVRLAPADLHAAREYAFLCHETRLESEAWQVFEKLKALGDPVGAEVFDRLSRELAESIARWSSAVELTPSSFSAHEELARLAERQGSLALAATHYEAAWKLRPAERKYLLDLGRVWLRSGDVARARAALLAASRGAEPHSAEKARELLNLPRYPPRYPWVSEFRAALQLDPANTPLHRELAWLLLEMNRAAEAEAEFREVLQRDAGDAWSRAQLGFLLLARNAAAEAAPLLEGVLADTTDDELIQRIRSALNLPRALRARPEAADQRDVAAEARLLARKSLEAGYLRDAVRYLKQVHEADPLDFATMLKLGWTHNVLREDRESVEWFRLARRSPDASVAREASRAYEALRPQFARFRTSVWAFPMYSTRWRDLFTWAQYRTEFRPTGRVYPYVSVRFAGDVRRRALQGDSPAPAMLSESAVIAAAGLTTRTWHGARAWAEVGYAGSYLPPDSGISRFRPDIRGGLSVVRHFGASLAAPESRSGLFAESNADILYISRFERDTLLYAQTRGGYTMRSAGPVRFQVVWNLNLTSDLKGLAWANAIETGPGVRFRLAGLPRSVVFSIDRLSGRYTRPDGSRPPQYADLRLGVWYAITR